MSPPRQPRWVGGGAGRRGGRSRCPGWSTIWWRSTPTAPIVTESEKRWARSSIEGAGDVGQPDAVVGAASAVFTLAAVVFGGFVALLILQDFRWGGSAPRRDPLAGFRRDDPGGGGGRVRKVRLCGVGAVYMWMVSRSGVRWAR